MEGYSSSVFGNHFDKNFSDFNKYEGFETNINIFADDDEQLKKLNDIFEKYSELFWNYRFLMRDSAVLMAIDPELKKMFSTNFS